MEEMTSKTAIKFGLNQALEYNRSLAGMNGDQDMLKAIDLVKAAISPQNHHIRIARNRDPYYPGM